MKDIEVLVAKMVKLTLMGYNSIEISYLMKINHDDVKSLLEEFFLNAPDDFFVFD